MGYRMPDKAERTIRLERELGRLTQILRELGALRIILIGSLAKGSVRSDSDIDLIVVGPWDGRFMERIGYLEERLQPRVAVDLLPYTPEEFNSIQHRDFFRRALQEGKTIYEI